MNQPRSILQRLFAVPFLVLVIAGVALTGFLSVRLVLLSWQSGSYGMVGAGLFVSAIWLLMFANSLKARFKKSADLAHSGQVSS